jgi:hypothetical protein
MLGAPGFEIVLTVEPLQSAADGPVIAISPRELESDETRPLNIPIEYDHDTCPNIAYSLSCFTLFDICDPAFWSPKPKVSYNDALKSVREAGVPVALVYGGDLALPSVYTSVTKLS